MRYEKSNCKPAVYPLENSEVTAQVSGKSMTTKLSLPDKDFAGEFFQFLEVRFLSHWSFPFLILDGRSLKNQSDFTADHFY